MPLPIGSVRQAVGWLGQEQDRSGSRMPAQKQRFGSIERMPDPPGRLCSTGGTAGLQPGTSTEKRGTPNPLTFCADDQP